RGHVRSPARPRQAPGEPRVPEVTREDSEGSAWHDPVEHEFGREPENADEEAGEDDQVREVVDGETEERVDVPGTVPAAGRRLRRCAHGRHAAPVPGPVTRDAPGWARAVPGYDSSAGGSLAVEERPGDGLHPFTERRTPGEARPSLGDLAVLELDRRRAGR